LYFCENFAKIYFNFKKIIQKYTKITKIFAKTKIKAKNFQENKNFSENENFYAHLPKNFTFWYNHILTRLFTIFWQKFSQQVLR
jgi:hypothetical protein